MKNKSENNVEKSTKRKFPIEPNNTHTPPPHLNKIINATTKIDGAELRIIISDIDIHYFRSLEWPNNFTILPIRIENDGIIEKISGNDFIIDFPPMSIVGLVSASNKGHEELMILKEKWQPLTNTNQYQIFNFSDSINTIEFHKWLTEQMAIKYFDLARRNVGLSKSLSVVRANHEDMQNSFRKLELFAEKTFRLDREIDLELAPQKQTLKLTGKIGEITQRIPINSLGLSDIAIHIDTAAKTSTGYLKIKLNTLEDNNTVGEWEIPSSKIKAGWLRFGLDKCLGTDERSLELQIGWEGPDGIILSLSLPHPEIRWCATKESISLERVLALKFWRGLPDTRPPASAAAFISGKSSPRAWVVPNDILKSVEDFTGRKDSVKYVEEKNAVLVHPAERSITIARLPQVCPSGAIHIWAKIETAHMDANDVEYSLAIVISDEAKTLQFLSEFTPDHSSDWVNLPATKSSEVHLFLPSPLKDTADLFLLTRIDDEATSSNCWALFSSIKAST